MRERQAPFENAERDSRLRCILCESLLPEPTTGAIEQEPASICLRCWALTPDERRLLRDRAMARVLRGDYSH
jgi:hypothetical protein